MRFDALFGSFDYVLPSCFFWWSFLAHQIETIWFKSKYQRGGFNFQQSYVTLLLDPNAQFLSMRCRRISSNPKNWSFHGDFGIWQGWKVAILLVDCPMHKIHLLCAILEFQMETQVKDTKTFIIVPNIISSLKSELEHFLWFCRTWVSNYAPPLWSCYAQQASCRDRNDSQALWYAQAQEAHWKLQSGNYYHLFLFSCFELLGAWISWGFHWHVCVSQCISCSTKVT